MDSYLMCADTSPNSGHTATLRPNSAKPNFTCPQNGVHPRYVLRNLLKRRN